MKKTIDILLLVSVIVPVILLFWPFVMWNGAISLIFRVIPSISIQVLLFRVGKNNVVKIIPTLLTGAFALWGTYLYFTSEHWINVFVWDFIADYLSPFICCLIVSIIGVFSKK